MSTYDKRIASNSTVRQLGSKNMQRVLRLMVVGMTLSLLAGAVIGSIRLFSGDRLLIFWVLSLIVLAASVVLSIRLLTIAEIRWGLPIWVLFGIFGLGYFAKFGWAMSDHEIFSKIRPILGEYARTTQFMLDTFLVMTTAFLVFVLVSFLLLSTLPGPQYLRKMHNATQGNAHSLVSVQLVQWLILVATGLFVGTTAIMAISGINRAGSEPVALPFRLAGITVYARSYVLPALLLLLIWISSSTGRKRATLTGYVLFFALAVTQMLFVTSRGALLMTFIPLIFLRILTKDITARTIRFVGILFLATVFFYPIITNLRFISSSGNALNIQEALINVSDSGWEVDYILTKILLRLHGADSVLAVIGAQIQPIGVLSFVTDGVPYGSVTRFFTVVVMGYPEWAIHANAPSLVGWFYMVDGFGAVIVGISLYLIGVWTIWRYLLFSRKLLTAPVAQAIFLGLLYSMSAEGTLDQLLEKLIAFGASILICEIFTRLFMANRFSLDRRHSDANSISVA